MRPLQVNFCKFYLGKLAGIEPMCHDIGSACCASENCQWVVCELYESGQVFYNTNVHVRTKKLLILRNMGIEPMLLFLQLLRRTCMEKEGRICWVMYFRGLAKKWKRFCLLIRAGKEILAVIGR